MLRRHEKDFLLRLDTKYLDRFLKEISLFNQQIDRLMPPSQRASMEPLLVQYRDQFQRLVDAYVQLGLTVDSGLMG